MQSKKIVTGAVLFGIITALAAGGCSKSSDQQASNTAAGAQEKQAVSQPVNHSSIIIEDLKSRLKEKPNDPDTLLRLGDTYFETKQFNESTLYYKKALEQKPGDADIYNDLGLSLHYLGNSAEGLKYIDEGAKKNPYHQRIWLTKGFILAYGMGDLDGARQSWEKAKSISPDSQIGKAASDFLAQFNKKTEGK